MWDGALVAEPAEPRPVSNLTRGTGYVINIDVTIAGSSIGEWVSPRSAAAVYALDRATHDTMITERPPPCPRFCEVIFQVVLN